MGLIVPMAMENQMTMGVIAYGQVVVWGVLTRYGGFNLRSIIKGHGK